MWHMKDNGQGYLFCKRVFIDLSPVKALEVVKAGQKSLFSNTCQLFSFLAKLNFLKASFTTTLYLLDLFDFDLHLVYFIMQNFPVTRE